VPHPQVSHDSNNTTASPEWTFWHDREWAEDVALFNYATQLFDEQTILFGLPGSSPHQKSASTQDATESANRRNIIESQSFM
jgi:hypothetical protein